MFKQVGRPVLMFLFLFMGNVFSWMSGRKWMDGWTDGWMDGWMEMFSPLHSLNIRRLKIRNLQKPCKYKTAV